MGIKFFQNRRQLKILGISTLIIFILVLFSLATFIYKLDQEMLWKLKQKQMILPTIFYTRVPSWKVGDHLPFDEILKELGNKLRLRKGDQRLFPGDYIKAIGSQCEFLLNRSHFKQNENENESNSIEIFNGEESIALDDQCLRIYWNKGEHQLFKKPWIETLWLSSSNQIKGVFRDVPLWAMDSFVLMPQVIAQYLGEEPIIREETVLREFPVSCLNAIMAIEDSKFLEHKGVSWIGIFRALVVNILKGRKAQGGSTLTQQLIKNYFLTPEKTIKRKGLEFIMALLMENRFDKDLILETYLNIIYMGQQGPYQIRGYGSAARHYFQKSITDLSLAQCSLLAAIVNSPGQFNPFLNSEKAKLRRGLVLQKMEEQKYITKEERELAEADILPKNENPNLYITLPYFLQAALFQAKKMGFEETEGFHIFTTMDLRYQEAAQTAIVKNVLRIENEFPKVKKIKSTKKIDLESTLVSIDLNSGGVRAVVGGRSFHKTQFNRILFSKRQVGSTFKPVVYLTALSSDENEYNPDDELKDESFTFKYDRQKWTPENYDKKSKGPVPMYYALKESLNLATAKLALDIGLNPVIELARLLGITSDLKPLPSLSLGAFELNPMELAQAYLTIGRFGNFIEYTFLDSIEDSEGNTLWDSKSRIGELRLSSVATQILIGILKQTALTGTAKQISLSGYDKVVAGKTGTTNDFRDSWFVGLTPDLLTIVWTGYDDNTSSGLTGASGSLPGWIEFMKTATQYDSIRDFSWTEEVEKKLIPAFVSPIDAKKNINPESEDQVELIFRK